MSIGMEALAQERIYYRYLNALDAREVLAHYNARNVTEMPGEEGTTELMHSCVLDQVDRHHNNGDAHPSACVNVEKRKFICYASGWRGDLFHLVMTMEGKESFSEALLAVSDLIHAGPDDENTFRAKLTKTMSAPGAYAIAPSEYSPNILKPWTQWSAPHPYLTSRGITAEAIDLLRLGWDEHENRIVFPHFFKGKLVGFQKRAVPPGPEWPATTLQEPKYRSSIGFPKGETLYGYDLAQGRGPGAAVVVESPFSVAKAYSLKVPLPVVATFGAKVTDSQIALLNNFDIIRVWFDADGAGLAGERHLLDRLPLNKVLVVEPDFGKDLGDYDTKDQVMAKLATAVPAFMKRARYETAALRKGMR